MMMKHGVILASIVAALGLLAFGGAHKSSDAQTNASQDAVEVLRVDDGGGWFRWPDSSEQQELEDQAEETVERFLALLGPMMAQMQLMIDDLPQYEAPEMLENGDIIIRRKRDPEDEIDGSEPTEI